MLDYGWQRMEQGADGNYECPYSVLQISSHVRSGFLEKIGRNSVRV